MAYLIKALLQVSSEMYYINSKYPRTEDELLPVVKGISICNISAAPVDVSVSIYSSDNGESFNTGAIIFNQQILAGATLQVVQERILQFNDIIEAYASIADVAAISIDIDNDNGRYLPAIP